MSRFVVGLDLGQARDFTAMAVLERIEGDGKPEASFHVRHLERLPLHTTYPAVVERVVAIMRSPALAGSTHLVADATGVGRAVIDLLKSARLGPVAVTITGGDATSHEGDDWRVPKRDLVAVLQVLLQSERLKIAAALPDADTLTRELLAFEVKITAMAHDAYGAWREGAHDDLVLAVALAAWWGATHALGPFTFAVGGPRTWSGRHVADLF